MNKETIIEKLEKQIAYANVMKTDLVSIDIKLALEIIRALFESN